MRFLKRTKWLFWTLTPFRRPRECAFLFLFFNWSGWNQCNLEWLKSKTPRPFLSNVAFFHMKCLFAPNPLSGSPKCTFQCPRGLISTQQKKIFWPALYKLLKAKLNFFCGKLFLIGCASFTAPMVWFFAATHASHYYLTITMQKLPKVPPAAICGVFAALGRRWWHQPGEPPSPTSKIHYDQYNVQHFMPFRIAVMLPTHQRILSDVRFLPKDPPKKILFSEQR